MSDYPQAGDPQAMQVAQAAEQRRRMGLPSGVDPRNYDPRRMMDSAAVEKLLHAQALARAEAQAASTVVVATIVSLVTSAFSFVAALAWNNAIQQILMNVGPALRNDGVPPWAADIAYAIIVTIIAVIAVLIINRFARNIAKRSAIGSGN